MAVQHAVSWNADSAEGERCSRFVLLTVIAEHNLDVSGSTSFGLSRLMTQRHFKFIKRL